MSAEARLRLDHHRDVLRSRSWWHGSSRLHREKRARVEKVLRTLDTAVALGAIDAAKVDRIGRDLQCIGLHKPVITGHSVGWTKDGAPILWFDVPGETDPEKAAERVRRERGAKLSAAGLEQFGVTTITSWRQIRPDELPKPRLPMEIHDDDLATVSPTNFTPDNDLEP
ncbi:hypothetical protein LAZ40_06900 [Cereibacter sphaeroides]|uniref:hypothetical protein n=1 Tax=Cereibacter sphaeroides TaxID=1063 RepID=UPI001F36AC72|nr:hypothetical protein [Cereibacter sphaeroides]MCE6958775.1 hypothetical protein [Cereibacter sphaeroides]MCE6973351.1 hypothetical protein [Cereibacter sphaeroides]